MYQASCLIVGATLVAMIVEDSAYTFRGQARSYELKNPHHSLFDRRSDLGRHGRHGRGR